MNILYSSTYSIQFFQITKQRKQRKSTSHKKDDSKRIDPNSKSEYNADTEYTPATLLQENAM